MKQYPEIISSSPRPLPFLLMTRDIVLTVLCWMLYLYFVRDAFVFFHDVGGYILSGFDNASDYPSFKIIPTIILYIEIIIATNLVYFLWAKYNKIRYGNKQRRRSAPPVMTDEIATKFKLNQRDIESWQNAQTLIVHHDADGRITKIVKV